MKPAEEYAKKCLTREISEIQKSKRDIKPLELTIDEKAIFFKYSNDGYEVLNENLRINGGKNDSKFGKLLDSILSKLPSFDGFVYRGANPTSLEVDKYIVVSKLNEVLVEPTFISSGKSRLITMGFNGNTLFGIYSRTGKEMEKIANFGIHSPQNEKEVLFKPSRQFKVLEVSNQNTFNINGGNIKWKLLRKLNKIIRFKSMRLRLAQPWCLNRF